MKAPERPKRKKKKNNLETFDTTPLLIGFFGKDGADKTYTPIDSFKLRLPFNFSARSCDARNRAY